MQVTTPKQQHPDDPVGADGAVVGDRAFVGDGAFVRDGVPSVPTVPPPTSTRRPKLRGGPVVTVRRNALVGGVATGIAHTLGIPVAAVRVAFVVLAFAGGAGVIGYVALWVIAEPLDDVGPSPGGAVAGRRALALVPALVGLLLVLRTVGLWFGDELVWPVGLAGVGALLIGARGEDGSRTAEPGALARFLDVRGALAVQGTAVGRRTVVRVAAGALLVSAGMALLLATSDALQLVGDVLPAMAVTAAGLALIVGPMLYRLARQLADERADRIRTQERADMAAHLHDSVLQTLAMIQRSSSPREMATLARGQERELRSWLYGEQTPVEATTLRDAVEALVDRIERQRQVRVDSVVVGNVPVDEAVTALVEAAGEALTNAAKHAGVEDASLYVEVEPGTATAFVRDAGHGFDPAAVPGDRRGISGSIRHRLARHGGTAHVTTAAGEGTEWQLQIPLTDAPARTMP